MPTCRGSVAPRSCRGAQQSDGGLRDPASVVRDFKKHWRPRREWNRSCYRCPRDIEAAIRAAALWRPRDYLDGPPGLVPKIPDHQRRVGCPALERAVEVLVRHQHALAACETFGPLHDLVAEKVGSLDRIGLLTIYDIAERFGCWRDIEPNGVCVHAGVLEGARALGLPGARLGATLAVRDLPRPFWDLTPGEVEDCLCIYKNVLRAISRGGPSREARAGRSRACLSSLPNPPSP